MLSGFGPRHATRAQVDAPAPRRQALEPEQLPDGHDPGPGRRRGYLGAHVVQGYLFSDLGGPLLGEGVGLRRKHEVQETDERPKIGTKSDPQPALYALVVADDQ